MAEKSKSLSIRQKRAIVALLTQPNNTEAAKIAKVGERTLYKWLRDKTFVGEYEAARYQIVSHTVDLLRIATTLATKTLMEIMQDQNQPTKVRLEAAKSVLTMMLPHTNLNQ